MREDDHTELKSSFSDTVIETLADAFAFEEELEAEVLAMVVEPHADAAFASEICLAGYLPFLQQNGLCGDGDLPGEVPVFFPVDGRRGCLIFMR